MPERYARKVAGETFEQHTELLLENGREAELLVNAQHVVAVTPLHSGLYVLHVDDRMRSQIPVSRNYAPEVRRFVRAISPKRPFWKSSNAVTSSS